MRSEAKTRSTTLRIASLPCRLIISAALSFSLSACVMINSSTISESTGGGAPISASRSDYGILRLSKPQGLTSAASTDLARQCPSGLITDVQTQLSLRDWFLIVQYYTVDANAICKPPPPPPPPPLPPPTAKIILRGVHFDFDRSTIRAVDAPVLDEAASTLKSNPGMTVHVNGYCDAIGSERYNLKLSERRAQAVVDYLEKEGIPANRLAAQGFGKTNFVASNDTKEGRAENRRVELVPEQ